MGKVIVVFFGVGDVGGSDGRVTVVLIMILMVVPVDMRMVDNGGDDGGGDGGGDGGSCAGGPSSVVIRTKTDNVVVVPSWYKVIRTKTDNVVVVTIMVQSDHSLTSLSASFPSLS